jgi:hypothetical protein
VRSLVLLMTGDTYFSDKVTKDADEDYRSIRSVVGGWFKVLIIRHDTYLLVWDEDDQGNRAGAHQPAVNERATALATAHGYSKEIRGDALACGRSGEDCTDVPADMQLMCQLLVPSWRYTNRPQPHQAARPRDAE